MALVADAWAWLVEAATTPAPVSVRFAVLFVHLWIGLATGRFGRARTTTWVLVVVVPVVIGTFSVVSGYVLPWGQVRFALAAWADGLPFVRGAARLLLAAAFDHGPVDVGGAVGWGLLLADMAVAYVGLWRGRAVGGVLWRVAVLVALAVVVAVVATRATAAPTPGSALTPMVIVPPWYDLPPYAVLRCVPDKLLGLALAAATALVPALWPLIGRGRATAFWPLWLGVAGVWVFLGALGGHPPDAATLTATRALAACWFAFFLLGPFLLGRGPLRGVSRKAGAGGRGETSG